MPTDTTDPQEIFSRLYEKKCVLDKNQQWKTMFMRMKTFETAKKLVMKPFLMSIVQRLNFKRVRPGQQKNVMLLRADGNRMGTDAAVHVHLPKVNRHFIAGSVGSNSVQNFWNIVHEHNVPGIVSFNQDVEDENHSTILYFPKIVGKTKSFGKFTIKCTAAQNCGSYWKRTLTVINTEDKDECVEIPHFQYMDWPDSFVPREVSDFLSFYDVVRESNILTPMKTTCFLGGRTGAPIIFSRNRKGRPGSFIMIDYLIRMIEDGVKDQFNVERLIVLMRRQFYDSIKTVVQLQFVYNSVIQWILNRYPQFETLKPGIEAFAATLTPVVNRKTQNYFRPGKWPINEKKRKVWLAKHYPIIEGKTEKENDGEKRKKEDAKQSENKDSSNQDQDFTDKKRLL
ncbi:unnamed protein product [Caenorhabditis sp. 36 PRJEB53466]|nr:unnamed protein product [Caenorhabditis sp. 36 PRJEB53466]